MNIIVDSVAPKLSTTKNGVVHPRGCQEHMTDLLLYA